MIRRNMKYIIAGIISLFLMLTPQELVSPKGPKLPLPIVLSKVDYSLENRYTNTFVNDVFSDNILLTLAYMSGNVKKGEAISWDRVRSQFTYRFDLKPGETFAFHERVLPEYNGKIVATTNSHFNSVEGFKSDGWLVGDGVCHLASFMNVVALRANLTVKAPTRHDFAKIADVPKENGVSIYYDPNAVGGSQLQNLYITNNREKTIAFVFKHVNDVLEMSVEEVVS